MTRTTLIQRFQTRVPLATKLVLGTLIVVAIYIALFRPDILVPKESALAEAGAKLGATILVLGYLGLALVDLHPSTKRSTMQSKGLEQAVVGMWVILHPVTLIGSSVNSGDHLVLAILALTMFGGFGVVNGIGMLITGKEGERQD